MEKFFRFQKAQLAFLELAARFEPEGIMSVSRSSVEVSFKHSLWKEFYAAQEEYKAALEALVRP